MTNSKGPRGKRKVRYTPNGIPIEAIDWTEADWMDLHYGMEAIKARIAKRHADARDKTEPIETNDRA